MGILCCYVTNNVYSKNVASVNVLNRSALQVTKRTDLYLKMEVIKRAVNFILMCVSLRFGIIHSVVIR